MHETSFLFDVLALLLAAVLVVPLLQRFNIPSVLGYLAAGVLLSRHTPGPVVDVEATRPLAEFGVVFLLFAIGLELPLTRLRTMRRYIFGLGLLQVAATSAVLAGLAFWAGLAAPMALVVGTTLAFSSTATVLTILVERNEAVSHHGRAAIAVLIFQDLAVVPILALLPLLAAGPHGMAEALGLAAIKAVIAIAVIFLAGRFIIRPIYGYISLIRNAEVFTAANLLIVLAVAWLTAEAGMSMALGAFLAGLLLADSPYRHQVEGDIEPFRGLLLGLFFMTVGMSIDLPFVGENGGLILALTSGLLLVKASIIAVLCLMLGLGPALGMQVGLLLAQVGEFAFVVFGKALELGILPQEHGQALIASVALSMVATPVLAGIGRRLSLRCQHSQGLDCQPAGMEELKEHVIIAGYGRVGRAIAKILSEQNISYVALDLDAERVLKARASGKPVFYGDASQTGVLRAVRVSHACAAVITLNDPRQVERTVSRVRQEIATLPIIARAHDLGQGPVLDRAGANAIVPETMEASLQMAGLVLEAAGLPQQDVDRSLQKHRDDRYTMLTGIERL